MDIELAKGLIYLNRSFGFKEQIKTIPCAAWDPSTKKWYLPYAATSVLGLLSMVARKDIPAELLMLVEEENKVKEEVNKDRKAEIVTPIKYMPLKKHIKPYQHQIKGYNMALKQMEHGGGFGFLFEMGCGKTLTAVATVGRLYLEKKIKKVLIIAPSAVVAVWPKEFNDFAEFDNTCTPLEGTKKKRLQALENLSVIYDSLQVAIINYEATWRLQDELMQYNADMIICDESQRIKTHTSKQSKCVQKLGTMAKYRLLLTGTPVQNSPMDFFSQYKFLDPSVFGNNFYNFRNTYAIMGGFQNHQIIDYKHLDELTYKAHSIALRVTKEEALDLPEMVDHTRLLDLEPAARKTYKELSCECITEIEETEVTASNILTKLLRLSQITGGFITNDDGITKEISKAKQKELKNIIDNVVVANNKKIVIFAKFTAEIDSIKKCLNEKNIKFAWIDGAVKSSDRGDMVEKFQKDEEVKVFIAQIQTAGLGITLHAASVAVFYSLDYNYASYEQAKARIHRIGQKNTCNYIHLICKDTVDEKVMIALNKKKNIAANVVDNWKKLF